MKILNVNNLINKNVLNYKLLIYSELFSNKKGAYNYTKSSLRKLQVGCC